MNPDESPVERRCKPCEGGVPVLGREEALAELRRSLHPDWSLAEDGLSIVRSFRFGDFHRTMAFVNAVAWVAHAEDHHPDLEVGYGRCLVRYSTHAAGGLTANDFLCAARIDRLFLA